MRTFSLKAGDIQRKWYLVDGEGAVVGRIASLIAKILRGKHDPKCTPHLDHGGCVILVNAEKIHFTGRKDKPFYWHTGHPGGIKSRTASEILAGPYPERVFEKAVERMLGKAGPLRRKRMKNLYVYAGPEHRHEAQTPETLDMKSWNPKNAKRAEHL
jgi:large subunit ribosomal protein L13